MKKIIILGRELLTFKLLNLITKLKNFLKTMKYKGADGLEECRN